MKTVCLIQPNFQQGPKELNSHYLPYSVGCLWAYAYSFPEIMEHFTLGDIVWSREDINAVANKIASSDVFAFSTYVWNKNYNYALATKVRELNPAAVIIFGGPEVPVEDKNLFKLLPFANVVVKTEGEIAFHSILHAIATSGDFLDITGLLVNDAGSIVDTGPAKRIENLQELPSPYTTGVFDQLTKIEGVEWNATLETNRGCPYQCTFCDWGSLTYNKVKKFELERVFEELDWVAKHKCGFISIADANFGMFVERDNAIVDKLLQVQQTYGYPCTFSVSWAKNQKAEVIELVKKLVRSPNFNQGLSLAVQSMDLDVLENIKRKNLGINQVKEVFDLCDKENIPLYTELILGLPGETLESWKKGVWDVFEAGNHTGVDIHQAQLLENAEMNLLQRKLYGIKSVVVYDYMSGSYNTDELKEGVAVVTETKTMPAADMHAAQMFNWFLTTFHINGITTYIARYLNKKYNISYNQFYLLLWDKLKTDNWFRVEEEDTLKYYQNWMTTGTISHPPISNIEIHGWNLVHRTTLNILSQNKHADIFAQIRAVLKDISPDDLTELVELQKYFFINYWDLNQYPVSKTFTTDYIGIIQDQTEEKLKYSFQFSDDHRMTLDRFLENVYFGRRRAFGKAKIIRA